MKQQRGLMIGMQSIFNAEDADLQADIEFGYSFGGGRVLQTQLAAHPNSKFAFMPQKEPVDMNTNLTPVSFSGRRAIATIVVSSGDSNSKNNRHGSWKLGEKAKPFLTFNVSKIACSTGGDS